ncbi:hypothetical protein BX661DRAFT_183071 [Kickxella alabastrina]|uniref:uncharacterized protein n=1 Tax=Kickxella alabastrina TaxID=61397 RepID=UPI00221F3C5C|nr:uncharacterized protein BX661DRAFT_183071 [Kickxella alabastrina]KAI7827330.1 hypothetical protein BX661DRAFT_183071 [Kickxella alabastrina]
MASSSLAWTYVWMFFDKSREWTMFLSFAAAIYYHNALVAHLNIGAVLCAVLAKGLKLIIRQDRPVDAKTKKTSFGMPSTHSASAMYFGTYLTYLLIGDKINQPFTAVPLANALAASAALLIFLNGYHSIAQVLAGSFLGVAFATTWLNNRVYVAPYIEMLLVVLNLQ